jgi:hypothetical protein
MHRIAEDKEEDEREEVVEEQDRAIAQRELQIDPGESEESFHRLRSLISVAVALWATRDRWCRGALLDASHSEAATEDEDQAEDHHWCGHSVAEFLSR